MFESLLSVSPEDIALTLNEFPQLPWAHFLLNPRRLRGSDFFNAMVTGGLERTSFD